MHSSVATSPPHEHPAALLASVSDLGDLRMIVVATAPLEGTERIFGLADAAFLRSGLAEIAFVVADELRGGGSATYSPERPQPSPLATGRGGSRPTPPAAVSPPWGSCAASGPR